jgi:hypothetical protein
MITANASFEGMDAYVSELSGVRFGGNSSLPSGPSMARRTTIHSHIDGFRF